MGLRDHVFIVRTWLESPEDPRTMRGHIDHVASGRRRYFGNFGDLIDFISGAQMSEPHSRRVDPSHEIDDPLPNDGDD